MTGVQTCALPICFPVTIEKVTEKTEHAKIWRLKPQNSLAMESDQLEQSIHGIIEEAARGNTTGAKQKIKELIPEYTPWLG